MKKSIYIIIFFTSVLLTACSQSREIETTYNNRDYNSISYQQFYDDLSPYGEWINDPDYGYVWRPGISDFRPYYSNGNWVYTNYGWTWVSNYNWGWAPFHYGLWFYDDFYGWTWIPGYEWAPAWVSWRSNAEYYGWAPLCPTRRHGGFYQVRNDQWAFVPNQYITRSDIHNYYINPQNNGTIINTTNEITIPRTFKNRSQYHPGPSVTEVEKFTNTKIKPLAVRQSAVQGNEKLQNGTLQIYKPVVKQNTKLAENIRPAKVVNIKDAPAPGTHSVNQPPVVNDDQKIKTNQDKITNNPVIGKPNINQLPVQPKQLTTIKENLDTKVSQASQERQNIPVKTNNDKPVINNDNQPPGGNNKLRQLPNQQSVPKKTVTRDADELRTDNINNSNPAHEPGTNAQPVHSKHQEQKAPSETNYNFNKIPNSPQANSDQRSVRERPDANFNRLQQTSSESSQMPQRSSSSLQEKINKSRGDFKNR